ncbi:Gfo/Idh/MocA family protein [Granulicella tundricola]|uniref:Oxidoreductase domain protein n=1 Tax=Granulicella tundricola (strain ATCC BAA-1859 / DSM 23138 / MP5ACTX9) TaxID=1198114 RepID=E8X3B7_GRATM|nr:Gfo/Idh/MocA family oxidoreductase [Granulicella tundricola]ADW70418.1 oxidoreductase domain protein [Granulicella tundricola MP5ACTX9]
MNSAALQPEAPLNRRDFLRSASALAASAGFAGTAIAQQPEKPNAQDKVELSQIHATTEQPEKIPGPFESRDHRTGFAIVGLGRLALGEILPAMGKSKYCKPTALVSGDRQKALKIAAQYGIKESSVYDYTTYDQLARNPDVQVIYIVLPNSMHADFTVRGARAGKHILCEKPMATTAKDCERMIAACEQAKVKLMIAYRSQYEPNDLALIKMIRAGKLGKLRQYIATNSQNQGDPTQWRQKKALAGGGCMPDVGVYCLNAARFLSDEEPYEVQATIVQPKDDPRFAEVEASCQVIAKFPSGFVATFNSSYNAHKSQFLRIEGVEAFAELNSAFAYHGIKLRYSKLIDGQEIMHEPSIEEKDQFAEEMDHMALCVQKNLKPHTPGEEGLQDQRITDAIYESARTGKAVKLSPPHAPTRSPDPVEA